jgi:hypothetical protein
MEAWGGQRRPPWVVGAGCGWWCFFFSSSVRYFGSCGFLFFFHGFTTFHDSSGCGTTPLPPHQHYSADTEGIAACSLFSCGRLATRTHTHPTISRQFLYVHSHESRPQSHLPVGRLVFHFVLILYILVSSCLRPHMEQMP